MPSPIRSALATLGYEMLIALILFVHVPPGQGAQLLTAVTASALLGVVVGHRWVILAAGGWLMLLFVHVPSSELTALGVTQLLVLCVGIAALLIGVGAAVRRGWDPRFVDRSVS